METRANWELLLEAAVKLTDQGIVEFSRRQLLDTVRESHPDRPENSLGPTLQGMTMNARGGPSSAGGRVFIRVGHGTYALHDAEPPSPAFTPSRPARQQRQKGRRDLIEAHAEAVIENFLRCLDIYDNQNPFVRSGQWSNHAQTIRLRRDLSTVSAALFDDSFISSLHSTLRSWGIGKRASRLAPITEFARVLRSHEPQLRPLNSLSIQDPDLDIDMAIDHLWRFIDTTKIVENRAKVVAATKTLHHLLPDLVPPMDREWTGRFFEWSLNDFQGRQHQIFEEGYRVFHDIAVRTQPSRYVAEGWRTSTTKLLDNAVIGYMLEQEATIARPPSPIDLRGMSTAELLDFQDLIIAELRGRSSQ